MSTKIIRRKYLSCRVSKEEKEQIEKDAFNNDKNTSDYIREKLLPETKNIPNKE